MILKYFFISLLFIVNFFGFSQAVTTNPTPIEVDQPVIITVYTNSTDTDCNGFNNPNKVYMHAGIGDDTNPWGFSVVGNWGEDDGVGLMTDNGDGTWSITLTPEDYFSLTPTEAANATKMGMVFRNEDGSQEFKDNGCDDFIFNVGALQVTMIVPFANTISYVSSGGSFQVMAQNTNGDALYELYTNGNLETSSTTSFFNYTLSNIVENTYCELVVTQGDTSINKKFTIVINPGTISETIPSGLKDGINYNESDATKATLVLTAPLKDFVYVAGSFNDWQPELTDAMKTDASTGKYWLEIDGLTPGEVETYQYWVFETTPIADSPKVVVTADPYSTLVLSPFDDPWIPATSYPNMPAYPVGQEREVTVLQTGQTPYNWQVENFVKPKKEDLIIYEVLIRDFDVDRTFQNLIDRVNYFKDLNINAIELMPVMEYEGNEGWGYNPAFHMALDKFYGPEDKLKEFIDLCHQNDIAVILDVALNHAMGRNPYVRMWMVDDDNDGWGDPSSENPFFNTEATHSYGIGNDFNHSSVYTKAYTESVIEYWIEEFKIDGLRWDLTKGFTQNCTAGDDACTNAYQQDRVDILKEYADFSWSVDPTHYVIFEHLGQDNEEQQWANYRVGEGKGVMMWGKMTEPYNQLTMGYGSGSNFNRMGYVSRGFTDKRLIGYAESHDEERLMYKNITYGNSTNSSHDVKDLDVALSRMPALGAVTLTIPGPKMIWHFGDLGMDNSINTCTDGSVDPECRLATKPQPQWDENWLSDTDRNQIYFAWARLNSLKQSEPVFEGDYSIDSGDITPRIYIWNDALSSDELKNVVVLANFDVYAQNIVPDFPYTGTWYNLMDNSSMTVSSTTDPINIEAGGFRIYGNKMATAAIDDELLARSISVFPNPATKSIQINKDIEEINIFDTSGKLLQFFDNYHQNQVLDISALKPAVYFVKLRTSTATLSKKLIIE